MLSREKQKIANQIHGLEEGLTELSREVHRHPEIELQKYKVVDVTETYLKTQGVEIGRDYCEILTSFHAMRKGRRKGPAMAFLAEYNAPRDMSHGRSHNVIAAYVVGAFPGITSKTDQYDSEVWLLGTSAEEDGVGEMLMLERNGFGGVEFALMMHPTGGGVRRNYINRGERASGSIMVSFRGKSAHSFVSSAGTSALDAAISVFNQIDMIRPTFGVQDDVNGVILEGGTAGNTIPEFSKCEFCIRAGTMKRVDELIGMIKKCIRQAQDLIGAATEIKTEPIYAERYLCLPLCKAFGENTGELGVSMYYLKPGGLSKSPDIGNVSIRIPAIHDYLSVTDDASIEAHSTEYAKVVAEPRADKTCTLGAEGLVITALGILTDGKLREESIAYHKGIVPTFHGKEQRTPEGEKS